MRTNFIINRDPIRFRGLIILSSKQGEDRKKIEEYEAGRINFENVLQDDIRQANNQYRNGNFVRFALCVQTLWSNAMRVDKKAILNLVEEREGERTDNTPTRGYGRRSMSRTRFLRLVDANPNRQTYRFSERESNRWREIFMLINEGLKRRYYGRKREWKKDELET